MKTKSLIIVTAIFLMLETSYAQQIKNVILLIPDGTSSSVITMSRWCNNNQPLAIDELLCGMIKTHSIDNKFPDSAPTATAYATGSKSIAGYIGVDSAAVPHISVLELAKMRGMSTGIVVTCEYPHATPADFVCHYPDRNNYAVLTSQFIFNSPTIVFAGGEGIVDTINRGKSIKDFKSLNYNMVTSVADFSQLKYNKDVAQWALFKDWNGHNHFKSYECDRVKGTEPSLSEMTHKAIEMLRQNGKGFFLMVEGSQVDWACHRNDPKAAVTDFIEFDKAIKEAVDFAKSNANTIVIVCPDHGNGGFSIGNKNSEKVYDDLDIAKFIAEPLNNIKWSGRKLAEKIIDSTETYANATAIQKYYNVLLPQDSINVIKNVVQKKGISYEKKAEIIEQFIGINYSEQNYIGWTTTGHTAEDVFLGIYTPNGTPRKTGIIDNTDIGKYIAEQLRFGNLKDSSDKYFCSHEVLFKDASFTKQANKDSLVIEKGHEKIIIFANSTKYEVIEGRHKKLGKLPTIAICIPKNRRKDDKNPKIYLYYIPKTILDVFSIKE